ncbi:UNVERIFIED_CONTAM: hypothetical protein RMT77_015867 [Armadillidium vulgare]
MKFFTVSLFVLLSSAILGGSFATPAHKNLGGLVEGVLHTVGDAVDDTVHTAGDLVDGVLGTVGNELLGKLPKLVDSVRNTVNELAKTTGKVLRFVVRDALGGIVSLVTEVLGCSITIKINEDTREISIGDHIIGTLQDDGSIVNPQNKLIGMCDREHGVVEFVGGAVDEVLRLVGCVGESLDNLLHSLDAILHNIIDNVRKALAKISDELSNALAALPSATADVLHKLTEDLHETGNAVVCAVEKVTDNIFSFRDVSGEIIFFVNAKTLEVTVAGNTIIGHINEDGSIVDSDEKVIGCLIEGLLIVVGNVLHNVLGGVGNLLR